MIWSSIGSLDLKVCIKGKKNSLKKKRMECNTDLWTDFFLYVWLPSLSVCTGEGDNVSERRLF